MRCDAGWQETGADFVGKAAVLRGALWYVNLSLEEGNQPAHNHIPNISKRRGVVFEKYTYMQKINWQTICTTESLNQAAFVCPIPLILPFIIFHHSQQSRIASLLFAGVCQFMHPDFTR